MGKILLVGTGGFLGSIFRYLISGMVHRVWDKTWFPYGTLTVNVTGCLLIGLLGGLMETRQIFNPEMRLFVFLGLLGGFTTFSTFGYETFNLMRDGELLASLSNGTLHLILGFGAVWFGNVLSRLI